MERFKHLIAASLLALSSICAAEPGVSENTITLGMSAPLSGPNGAYGMEMQQTIQAYFSQINKAGGVNGRKLELVALDDGYETERAVANTQSLIKDKQAFALLSFFGSSPTEATMNTVFGPAGVPLVGTISGAPALRQPIASNPNSRFMFHIRASYNDETEAIVNQMVALGLRSIAVFYQNDGFGKAGLDGVTAALKKHELTPAAVGTVERNALDVKAAVQAISKVNPQAVVMVSLYKPTTAFVRAMKDAGQHPMLMTLSPIGTEQLIQDLGKDSRGIGISQVVPYPWNDTIPVVREYQKLAAKAGQYSYYGLEAYLTARVMVEGLRRAGRDLSREKLVSALESINNVDFGGYRINYSATARSGSRFVEMTVIGPGGKLLR
jgi:ABC-type branched-subunit amino acid transport system substrate-binding protein